MASGQPVGETAAGHDAGGRFLVRRLLFGLLVLWITSGAVFVLFFVAPHDPARLIAGKLATPQTVALVNHRLGLD